MNISSKSSIEVVDRFCVVGDMLSVCVSVDCSCDSQDLECLE